MPKKQFSARLPDKSMQQIEELQAKLGMTKVQVMVMALDRLARQELKPNANTPPNPRSKKQ